MTTSSARLAASPPPRHEEPVPVDYIEPQTIAEAEARYADAQQRVVAIQLQLGRRANSAAPRIEQETYWRWRHRAKRALGHALHEQLLYRRWIKAYRQRQVLRKAGVSDAADVTSLLSALLEIAVERARLGWVPDDHAQAVMQLSRDYLREQSPPAIAADTATATDTATESSSSTREESHLSTA